MNVRRGIVLATIVTALMSLAAPAWAIIRFDCTDRGGFVRETNQGPVCFFPSSRSLCGVFGGYFFPAAASELHTDTCVDFVT